MDTQKATHTPCIVRAEIGGGFLIVFPTIPMAPIARTTRTLPLAWSSHDGHSAIDHGYYIKYTKPVTKDIAAGILEGYLKHHNVTEPLLATAWTPEHDSIRDDEAWRTTMHSAADRMASK